MTTLRILMVQTAIDWNDPAANRARMQSMLEKHAGSYDLVVLPETFTTGFLGGEGGEGESMDGPTVAWMQDTCARYGGALAGSMVIGENGNRYNRFLFATADGIRAHYDKRHLFSYGGEDGHYTAGSDRVNVDYLGWRINLQVCYDLRFPAWCRYRGDYDLMLLVANWPVRRIHHWSTLLEARAIENQSCVVGLNRVGKDGHGLYYPGASAVHGPMGETVVKLGDEDVCQLVELDLDDVRKARSRFPFQEDSDNVQIV